MVIITEDIIRKTLNESINEFMINEGGAWDGVKNWANRWGLNKAWNGIKNAAATYMDWRTGGDWNAKYGIYNNSTGKTTELYYLNQWFNWHVEQIQRLEERKIHPNDDSYRERSYKYNDKNEKIYTEVEDNYGSVEQYVKANIHAENFNVWIGKRIPNRQALKIIDEYINNIGKDANPPKIINAKTAGYYLNIGTFEKLYGKAYFNSTKGDRQTYNAQRQLKIYTQKQQAKQQQKTSYEQQIAKVKKQIKSWSDFIKQQNGSADWTNLVLNSLYHTNGLPDNVKKWIDEIISSNIAKSPDKVGKYITYKRFLTSNYGTNYRTIENYLQKMNQTQQP